MDINITGVGQNTGGGHMKVLLIDDSLTMRKMQEKVLNDMGITNIVEAEDGMEGMEKLKSHEYKFDLALLDLNMPKMDGMEMLKLVKQTYEAHAIPVIICSSVSDKEKIMEAIKIGADNYLVKPFQPEDLRKKIEAVFAKLN